MSDQVQRDIGELRVRIERLEYIVTKLVGHSVRKTRGRPHLELIREALTTSGGAWLTCAEIAARCQISNGAVRTQVYERPDLFESTRVSAGRVKWRLRAGAPA